MTLLTKTLNSGMPQLDERYHYNEQEKQQDEQNYHTPKFHTITTTG